MNSPSGGSPYHVTPAGLGGGGTPPVHIGIMNWLKLIGIVGAAAVATIGVGWTLYLRVDDRVTGLDRTLRETAQRSDDKIDRLSNAIADLRVDLAERAPKQSASTASKPQ